MSSGPEPFVGRANELALVRAALAETSANAVLIAGEPGIGKSRLAAEAVSGTRRAVFRAVCWQGDGAPPFWPWAQVIRAGLASPEGREWERSRPPGHGEVLALLPERTDLAGDSDASRFRLFEGVGSLLRALAGNAGAVVIVDDLQWCDEASLRLLTFAVRSLCDVPITFLGTYRHTELDAGHPLGGSVAELAGLARHLSLIGLPPDDLGRLSPEGGPGGAELHRITGGNPFFAREVLALAAIRSSGDCLPPPLPEGVRAVIDRRLARLSTPTAELLQEAAVQGNEVDPDLLGELTGSTAAGVGAALGEAVAAGLLTMTGPAGTVQFAHDLVRETLYDSIPVGRRAGAHARLAEQLARRGCGPTILAQHLREAVPLVEPKRAAEAARVAADHALGMFAFEEAAAWYERAVPLVSPEPDATQAELLLGAGEARMRAGDVAGARDRYGEATAFARRLRRPDLLGAAALGLGAGLSGFEITLLDRGQINLLEEALAALPGDDSPLRAQLLARLSVALSFVDSPQRRLSLAEQAVAMARRSGDRRALAHALAAHCDAIAGPDQRSARRREAAEIVELGMAEGDTGLSLLGRRLLVVALLEGGETAEVDRQIEDFSRGAEMLRQPVYRWYAPLWRGMRALMAGRTAESERWCEEAEAVGALAQSTNARMLVFTQRWVRLRVQGDFEASGAAALEGEALFVDVPGATVLGAMGLLHCGDTAAASAAIDAAAPMLPLLPFDAEWPPAMAQAAEVVAALGARDHAAVLAELMAPYDDCFVVEGIGAAVYGTLGSYRAPLLELLGRNEEAAAVAATSAERERGAGLSGRPARPPAGQSGRSPMTITTTTTAALRREGDVWAITFAGHTARVRDSKGIRDLARLLAAPGRQLHVRQLLDLDPAAQAALAASGIEVLDRRAVTAYRRRLAELDDDLAEAETNHDLGRAATVRAERDFLLAELAGGLGMGGKARRSGDGTDRARKAVTARIRDAIGRIGAVHPELARHFNNAVRTGAVCAYDPEQHVTWTVDT